VRPELPENNCGHVPRTIQLSRITHAAAWNVLIKRASRSGNAAFMVSLISPRASGDTGNKTYAYIATSRCRLINANYLCYRKEGGSNSNFIVRAARRGLEKRSRKI